MSATGNSFGKLLKITTFGESHGDKIGVVIEGIPSNFELSVDDIEVELKRRRPGQSLVVTDRNEKDSVEIVSGLFKGKTTGVPIVLMTKNSDQRGQDYDQLQSTLRPGHADFTYWKKYHHFDYRGGGRSSARETWGRVAAGAIVKKILRKCYNIEIISFVDTIYNITIPKGKGFNPFQVTSEEIEKSAVRCPHLPTSKKMEKLIKNMKKEGNSVGGILWGIIKNVPAGLGEPVYDRYEALLAHAMMGINASRGFELGDGFATTHFLGDESVDQMRVDKNKNKTIFLSNHSGGIMGGISRGDLIYFKVAFKAPSSIKLPLKTIDQNLKNCDLELQGRHDPCVLPRAVPIVEAMAALVTYDLILRANNDHLFSKV